MTSTSTDVQDLPVVIMFVFMGLIVFCLGGVWAFVHLSYMPIVPRFLVAVLTAVVFEFLFGVALAFWAAVVILVSMYEGKSR